MQESFIARGCACHVLSSSSCYSVHARLRDVNILGSRLQSGCWHLAGLLHIVYKTLSFSKLPYTCIPLYYIKPLTCPVPMYCPMFGAVLVMSYPKEEDCREASCKGCSSAHHSSSLLLACMHSIMYAFCMEMCASSKCACDSGIDPSQVETQVDDADFSMDALAVTEAVNDSTGPAIVSP